MRVNVIENSSPELFNAMILPEMSQEARGWLEEQVYRGTESLSSTGRMFAEMAQSAYKRLTDSSIMRQARAVIRDLSGAISGNRIRPIENYSGLQAAPPVMQRYLMAHPEYRKLYHQQRCNGYSDTYVDLEPGYVGEKHYDYRRVMNSVLVDTPTGWEVTMYPDDLHEGDRGLYPDEQKVFLNAYELMTRAIGEGVDPGDIYNSPL